MNASLFIHLLQSKPNKAIYYLYRKSGIIKNWIKANSGSDIEADDVLQDGITILYKNLSQINAQLTTAPENYLMGICKNLWLSELRKQKRLSTIPLETSKHAMEAAVDAEEVLNISDLPLILDHLGTKCNRLLKLFYFEKESMEFIAKKLNFRNDKVAKAMKYKCLQKARNLTIKNQ